MKSRGNKYGARKVECRHGHKHDSMAEAKTCCDLHFRQAAGEIRELKVHPRFELTAHGETIGFMKPDFGYWADDARVVHEVKSEETAKGEAYRLRKRLFQANYPGVRFVEEVR